MAVALAKRNRTEPDRMPDCRAATAGGVGGTGVQATRTTKDERTRGDLPLAD